MHNPYDVDDLLDRLLRHSASALDAVGAGILLQDDDNGGRLAFAAASSEIITKPERLQDDFQTGICHEAFIQGQVIAVSGLTSTDHWGEYAERVLELGMSAVLGVPLTAWDQTIGVLDLYRDHPTPWTDADLEAAEMVAAMGAAYILGATRMQAQFRLSEQLHAALKCGLTGQS